MVDPGNRAHFVFVVDVNNHKDPLRGSLQNQSSLQAALTRDLKVTRMLAWSLPQKAVSDGRMPTVNLLAVLFCLIFEIWLSIFFQRGDAKTKSRVWRQ